MQYVFREGRLNLKDMCIGFLQSQSYSGFLINFRIFYPFFRASFLMSNHKRKRSEDDEDITLVQQLTQRLEKAETQILFFTKEMNDLRKILTEIQSKTLHKSGQTETDGPNLNTVGQYKLTTENEYVVVYTDGACENNGKTNAKAGIGVYFGAGCPLNVSRAVVGRPTNNTAEIQACTCALKIAVEQGIKKLKIRTDSKFVINSITQWIHKWKKNNWKLVSGGDVKNKEDFVVLDNYRNRLDSVEWEYIEGHKGHPGNEEADRLARNGALLYKK